MKELSVEEKAKAYDETLNKARKHYEETPNNVYKAMLENLFPELAESEDEKIRKELISFLQLPHPQFVGERKQEKWITWLEKQGQKPTEWHREDEQNLNACLGYIPDEFLRRWLTDIIHIKYDKSAWSKEDDVMVNDILRCLPAKSRPEYNQRRADWIKSLKGRVQPEQEWSEEDESMYTRTLGILGKCYMGQLPTKVEDELNWLKYRLKYLIPQNQWKPSDEQMYLLSWIANVKLGDGVVEQEVSKHLNELYNDLKKLREG